MERTKLERRRAKGKELRKIHSQRGHDSEKVGYLNAFRKNQTMAGRRYARWLERMHRG